MKKVKLLLLCFLVANTTVSFAQKKDKIRGNRNVKFIQTPVENYNTLEIGEDLEISLVQGQMAMVEVEADENLHEVINFVSANGRLSVQTTKRIASSKTLSIRVYHTQSLVNIIAKDNAKISTLNDLNMAELHITASNAAELYMTMTIDDFKLTASDKTRAELNLTSGKSAFVMSDDSKIKALINGGECNIDLYQDAEADIEGDVQQLSLRADNTTNFEGENFTAVNASLIAEGRTNCTVNTSELLSVEASDGAKIYIHNTPKITLEKFHGNATLYKKE